ncbi:hypothetical protein DFH07DRAFT_797410 [Mycena maculata]|uniref:FAD-binding PCMH-type domain-containing protein n=1 Tax=Mycena maculata TaxID=230809 RepID=A0AAD7K3L8_9AGAR|nr:hypothetical protein DFH07DRAFT_797410 [Mycena maculata]
MAEYTRLPRSELVALLQPTFHCIPGALFAPTSVYHCELAVELARRDRRVLRPVGIGHSPSDVACTTDYTLDMTRMNRVQHVDKEQCWVRAEAGITLSDLHAALAPHGLAIRNLGSISDQTLTGIVATVTHGSGVDYGILELTLLLPDGSGETDSTSSPPSSSIVTCSRTQHPDLFNASLCGLGTTGLILTITLELEHVFRLRDTHTLPQGKLSPHPPNIAFIFSVGQTEMRNITGGLGGSGGSAHSGGEGGEGDRLNLETSLDGDLTIGNISGKLPHPIRPIFA